MKKMIRNLWIATTLLLSVSTLIAQDNNPPYERTQGYYTLGLNTGFSYLASDVRNQYNGYGVGLTLAKNLYYRPGAPITFDIRGRLLYDESYGLSPNKSFAVPNNDALNGTGKQDYTTDSNSSGFVYNNFQTRMAELGIEGVFHFNKLRERTRFDLSLYGGLGLDWYQVKLDQADNDGNYATDYAEIDATASNSNIKSQLKNNILDGKYETHAHSFDGKYGKLGIMPGAGFDLEYNLTNRFSIGVGHKFTFARNDVLDGQVWNNDNEVSANNDFHNYTNLDLRWILKPREKKQRPPEIDVTTPRTSPHTDQFCDGLVKANIMYVNSAADIDLKVNGRPTPYSFSGEKFSATFPLKPGKNDVRIYAKNAAGSDQEAIIIFCEDQVLPPEPTVYAPRVNITNPNYDNYRTNDSRFQVEATIENIASKSDIDFTVNGKRKDFDYNPRNGRFTSTVGLTKGNNEVVISARNSAGNDRDDRTIILEYKTIAYPSVDITSPSSNPYETTGNRVNVRANVKNVDSKSDIRFFINDRTNNNFSYSGSNERVEATVNLQRGRNVIKITASNERGNDSDQTVVIYIDEVEDNSPACGPIPIVEITRPETSSSNTSSSTANIKATVKNVESKSDIRMTLNGSNYSNFTYNQSSRILIAAVSLKDGNNTVKITGTNSYGTDSDEVVVRKIGTIGSIDKKPTIDIKSPSNNSTTSTKNASVKATVKYVDNKSQIRLTLNGSNISNFNYNALTRELNATVNLKSGSNTIKVTATTSGGSDSDQVKVTYKSVSKPVVKISSPKNNSKTSKKKVSLKSTVSNVTSKSDVKVTFNGKNITSFKYFGGKVTATLSLKAGKNTIKIKGTNSAGSDEETTVVTLDLQKPVITIISPKNTTLKKPAVILKAKVEHVNSKNDIRLTFNGKTVSSFSYSTSTKILTANLSAKYGTNPIVIKATNDAGTADKKLILTYKQTSTPTIQKPIVTITSIGQPTADPFDPGPLKSTLLVTVKLVNSKKNITLTINGKKVTNFTYDNSTGLVRHSFEIVDGTNKIQIKATNSSGTTTVDKNHNF